MKMKSIFYSVMHEGAVEVQCASGAAQCTLHYSSLLSERLCLTDGFNLFAQARLFSASSGLGQQSKRSNKVWKSV